MATVSLQRGQDYAAGLAKVPAAAACKSLFLKEPCNASVTLHVTAVALHVERPLQRPLNRAASRARTCIAVTGENRSVSSAKPFGYPNCEQTGKQTLQIVPPRSTFTPQHVHPLTSFLVSRDASQNVHDASLTREGGFRESSRGLRERSLSALRKRLPSGCVLYRLTAARRKPTLSRASSTPEAMLAGCSGHGSGDRLANASDCLANAGERQALASVRTACGFVRTGAHGDREQSGCVHG